MSLTIIDSGWSNIIEQGAALREPHLRIVCPFIKLGALRRLLANTPKVIEVITRFNLADFASGVSDISALRLLVDYGAKVRGVRGLHAKVYLFGSKRAVVTSANLTRSGLETNHEFGFVADDAEIVARCQSYFKNLWDRAGANLDTAKLDEWEGLVATVVQTGATGSQLVQLPDNGADAGVISESVLAPESLPEQSFVKFFGSADDRADRALSVSDEIDESGSHWAAAYPNDSRPRGVQDGAIIFISRLVHNPDDILIYGRAIASRYVEFRDDATPADIALRSWKKKWPHYIRLHRAEFVAGTLANGVSLNTLMDQLGSVGFARTKEHAGYGAGNVDPRMSIRRQPAVALSAEGYQWVQSKLMEAFVQHGKIPEVELERFDRPTIPILPKVVMPPPEKTRQNGAENSAPTLSPRALRLLRVLRGFFKEEWLDIRSPKTFPTYSTALREVGIVPREGARLGPQFETEAAGRELNEWLRDSGKPAITGLVVTGGIWRPGGEYFKSNGREETDEKWWLGEIRRAREWTDWPEGT